MNKTILVVGGAGYIGSHTAYLLHQAGYRVVILDKFVYDQRLNLPWAEVIKSDFADEKVLKSIFGQYKIEAVIHFAASIEVGESVKYPAKFYDNNVVKTLKLLDAMVQHGVNNFVFSSSCAVYGNPVKVPINETHPFAPISPYGKNKLIVEYALQDYAVAYGLKYISLRYFNAAGALPEQGLGECHKPETHAIPLLLMAALKNRTFTVFGKDYNTPDGTCVRDYIHVLDIAQAHVLALQYIEKTNSSNVFNLGSEKGYSLLQLIQVVKEVVGVDLKITFSPHRAGDVDVLVADATKIKTLLGWQEKHSSLPNIVRTALNWHLKYLI